MMQLSQLGHRNLTQAREDYTLATFLEKCGEDPMLYASAPERLLKAIGEPEVIDTSEDERLSRIFHNRVIKRYKAFADFYGMEKTIEEVVAFLRSASLGLEECKQVLYLMGPVGGGKSSLAEKLKSLMEVYPIYVLAIKREDMKGDFPYEVSPVFEHPFGLFDAEKDADELEKTYKIPRRYLGRIPSPWAVKRITDEFKGDISKFCVIRMQPSQLRQIGVCKVEPGDENNQDISTLVGKVDLRKLEMYSQEDPDAYSFSGGLCRANQGLMEFVEMFKAPIKVLHPLLTATQERHYKGTEPIGAIPFDGMAFAHSNETEWEQFRKNKHNEAFLNRVNVIDVPYCLRVKEEELIYKKLVRDSALANAPDAPKTLETLASYSVLTRMVDQKNSSIYAKLRVYNGETLKDIEPDAKSHQEYMDAAGPREGMSGYATRDAFKIVSKVFCFDPSEVAANPVHLFAVLEDQIRHDHGKEGGELTEEGQRLSKFLTEYLIPRYQEFLGKEMQTAYLESYSEYGQNQFDRYILYADYWCRKLEYRDHDSAQIFDYEMLDSELSKLEKPAGIANPKEFRNEVVQYALRHHKYEGKNPSWTSYEKLKQVIEKSMFKNMEEIMPVISFNAKASEEDTKKHEEFLSRMLEKGYTRRQVRILVEWYIRSRKS